MTWSYNTILLDAQDQVRFYAGDTDSTAAVTLSDEEILGAITMAGNARAAAALVCENLAGRYATFGRRFKDDLGQEIDYGERATFYQARAKELRSRASLIAIPFAGGISIAAKQTQEQESDRVAPAFSVETHADPGVALLDDEAP